MIEYKDFTKLDIRVGKIIAASDFPEARNPAYKLEIDLGGEIGIKYSSAQITPNYRIDDLLGKLVLCVINLPEKRIAGFKSEVLTLGLPDFNGNVKLITPDGEVPLGGKLY